MSSEKRSQWWSRPVGHMMWCCIASICATLRMRRVFETEEAEKLLGNQPVIIVLWHNRTFMPCHFYRRVLHGKVPMSMLTSASKDGAILETVANDYGMRAVRGSSHRRGVAGFLDMVRELEAGCCMCITPDGPKGPRYKFRPGAVRLAAMSGLPILPVSMDVPHCWRVNSAWDGYIIPKPFSKVTFRIGAPVYVPRDLTPEQQEEYCTRLYEALAHGRPDFEPITTDN